MSEELKLLPCFNPECGCKEAIIHMAVITKNNMWFVECTKDACSMHGSAKFTKEEAIAAWNAIPRALTWTTEPPEVEGWYWVRSLCPVSQVPSPATVFLYAVGMDMQPEFKVQYAGPIPTPQEPIL